MKEGRALFASCRWPSNAPEHDKIILAEFATDLLWRDAERARMNGQIRESQRGIRGNLARKACLACCVVLLASPALPLTRKCEGTNVSVTSEAAGDADLACTAAVRSAAVFAQCVVPVLSRQIAIDIIKTMPRGCVGLYHCGEDRLEVLATDVLPQTRANLGVLPLLATEPYFQSIVVHELAHAATDGMPCPVENCVVAPEYIGYLMQVMSLDPVDLAEFEDSFDMTAPVSIQELNPFVIVLAPEIFVERVWAHHWQQSDPCGFVAQLLNGEAVLDFEFYDN